jgi:hypothetical protein
MNCGRAAPIEPPPIEPEVFAAREDTDKLQIADCELLIYISGLPKSISN